MKKLIIGLGNPGKQYEWTRHNIGWIILDSLKEELDPSTKWEKHHKVKAEITKIGNTILMKPLTFMNKSGEAVQQLMAFYKLAPEDILVIHDDLDMDFLKTRKVNDSGSGGNNGVQSIIDYLGTKKFDRLKIGISNKKRSRIPADRFVLMPFGFFEKREIKKELSTIITII